MCVLCVCSLASAYVCGSLRVCVCVLVFLCVCVCVCCLFSVPCSLPVRPSLLYSVCVCVRVACVCPVCTAKASMRVSLYPVLRVCVCVCVFWPACHRRSVSQLGVAWRGVLLVLRIAKRSQGQVCVPSFSLRSCPAAEDPDLDRVRPSSASVKAQLEVACRELLRHRTVWLAGRAASL